MEIHHNEGPVGYERNLNPGETGKMRATFSVSTDSNSPGRPSEIIVECENGI